MILFKAFYNQILILFCHLEELKKWFSINNSSVTRGKKRRESNQSILY